MLHPHFEAATGDTRIYAKDRSVACFVLYFEIFESDRAALMLHNHYNNKICKKEDMQKVERIRVEPHHHTVANSLTTRLTSKHNAEQLAKLSFYH